jgi:hypothetical protein
MMLMTTINSVNVTPARRDVRKPERLVFMNVGPRK